MTATYSTDLSDPTAPSRGSTGRRMGAVMLRYAYLLRGSFWRVLEIMFWPTVQLIMWGFISRYVSQESGLGGMAVGFFLSAVLLWEVAIRAQIGLSMTFFEEMWSRNLGHLFVTPLRPWEWTVALMAISLLRTIVGLSLPTALAILVFDWEVAKLGLALVLFFSSLLLFGWAIGLVCCGAVLRWGMSAESMSWMATFVLGPFCCVFYPLSVLPAWVQPLALALPPTHAFEGMRAAMAGQAIPWDGLAIGFALNALYIAIGIGLFMLAYRSARQHGRLLNVGE